VIAVGADDQLRVQALDEAVVELEEAEVAGAGSHGVQAVELDPGGVVIVGLEQVLALAPGAQILAAVAHHGVDAGPRRLSPAVEAQMGAACGQPVLLATVVVDAVEAITGLSQEGLVAPGPLQSVRAGEHEEGLAILRCGRA
jgi:hypothetical protein